MSIAPLTSVFKENKDNEAVIWESKSYSYSWLLDRIKYWQSSINLYDIGKGTVVALEADFSPNSIALILTLIEESCIIVPLNNLINVL